MIGRIVDLIKSRVKGHTRTSRKGKTTRVKAHERKQLQPSIKAGVPVYFRPEGAQRLRVGTVTSRRGDKITVQGRRTSEGIIPEFKLHVRDAMTVAAYKKAKTSGQKRKTDPAKYETRDDRKNSHFNVTGEEFARRKKLTEKRIGVTEDAIVNHAGFKGVAFKIASDLAKENRISTELNDRTGAILWHRAKNADYQELLLRYTFGAIKGWRAELSKKMTPQVKENIAEFKKWLNGDVQKSYISTTMALEGKREAIRYLQERRRNMKELSDMDFSEMGEDPETRRMLESVSKEPQQINYTMHKRGETLIAAVKSAMKKLPPRERHAVMVRIALPPYHDFAKERKGFNSHEQVAAVLNQKNMLNDGKKWTRNTTPDLLESAFKKLKEMPEYNDFRYFYEVYSGREKAYPSSLYLQNKLHAGTTTEDDIEKVRQFNKLMNRQARKEGVEEERPSGAVQNLLEVRSVFKKSMDDDTITMIDSMTEILEQHEEKLKENQKVLCCDFDGVIADYSKGYQGKDVFGEPIHGCRETLAKLQSLGWMIIVFTTREDTKALRGYLAVNDIPYDYINYNPEQPEGSNQGKPIADVYLDDRAYRFTSWRDFSIAVSDGNILEKSVHFLMDDPTQCAVSMLEYADDKPLGSPFEGAMVKSVKQGICYVFGKDVDFEELEKSYSADLKKQYPGGRWVTIKEGPLAGRHIYILPHADGSATVLAGGGPALRHKVLNAKRDDDGKTEKPPEEQKKKEEKKPEPEKPKLSEEDEKKAKEKKKEIAESIKTERKKMAATVKERMGVDVEVTPEERDDIAKKVGKILDPEKRQKKEKELLKDLEAGKKDTLDEIIRESKMYLMDEDVVSQMPDPEDMTEEEQEKMTLRAAVKECAEELAESHYRIKALMRERKEINKMMKTGKSFDKFSSAEEVRASFESISKQDMVDAILDEKAREAELDAHYRLVGITRGIEGVDSEIQGQGKKKVVDNITQGGFEAVTGLVGGYTDSAIMDKDIYKELGSRNAAILARYYLESSGHNPAKVAEEIEGFISENGNPVAMQANERGDHFLELSERVIEFGKGSDNLMTAHQANATAMKYSNKAYEAFGQAEGALNQGAEMLYALKDKERSMSISANSKDAINRKRQALGLKASDVNITHERGEGYKMTIPPRSFEKLIDEQPTEKHGHGLGYEFTAQEIKSLHANTDDFKPAGINEFVTFDNGETIHVPSSIKPEQQAAARMIAQQKRVYLNFEAGTGKSLAVLLAKGHIEETTGKPVKTIIAMPSKLMDNFADEVRQWSDFNVVKADSANANKRREAYNSDANTIVLVNKEKFNFDKHHIKQAGFGMVVADEAHKITQREGRSGSEMSQGLKDVANDAEYYVAMSGTPTPSDLSELYFHANLIDPERFGNQKKFMEKFGSSHKGVGYKQAISEFMNSQLDDNVYTAKKVIRGAKLSAGSKADIHAKLKANGIDPKSVEIKRNADGTHSAQLPEPKLRLHRHEAKLHPAQKKLYKQASEAMRNKSINPLQRDAQYNVALNSHNWQENGKFDEVHKIVENHMKTKGPNEKVIFYAKNRATLNQIKAYLAHHHPDAGHVEFTGETKKKELSENKRKFKEDPNVRFSLHMRAGVEGLNLQLKDDGLQGATTAIAVASGEDSYAPLDQFFSRAHRTGALKDIDAHLILTDTPHDIGTQLRLDEKKGVGELVQNKKMGKKTRKAA